MEEGCKFCDRPTTLFDEGVPVCLICADLLNKKRKRDPWRAAYVVPSPAEGVLTQVEASPEWPHPQ